MTTDAPEPHAVRIANAIIKTMNTEIHDAEGKPLGIPPTEIVAALTNVLSMVACTTALKQSEEKRFETVQKLANQLMANMNHIAARSEPGGPDRMN